MLGVYYDQLNPLDQYGYDIEYLNSDYEDEDPYINDDDDGDIPPIPALSIDLNATVKEIFLCSFTLM